MAVSFSIVSFLFYVVGYVTRRFGRFWLLSLALLAGVLFVASMMGLPIRWEVPFAFLDWVYSHVWFSWTFLSTPSVAGLASLVIVSGFLVGLLSRHKFFTWRTFVYPVMLALLMTGLSYATGLSDQIAAMVEADRVEFSEPAPSGVTTDRNPRVN